MLVDGGKAGVEACELSGELSCKPRVVLGLAAAQQQDKNDGQQDELNSGEDQRHFDFPSLARIALEVGENASELARDEPLMIQ
jgi:hypothetical protein